MTLRKTLLTSIALSTVFSVAGCGNDNDHHGNNPATGGAGGRNTNEGGTPATGGRNTVAGGASTMAGAGGESMMGTGGMATTMAGAGGESMMGTGGMATTVAGAGGKPGMGGTAGQAGASSTAGASGQAGAGATAFRLHIENVAPFDHLKSGTFATPVDATDPGPLAPGDAYEFTFTAGPHHRLSFATMFGQSNDWFFAPEEGSLALYDGDTPISGDITAQVALWDAGTEVDEEPAVGPHTGPNQSSSTDGPGAADPDDTVRLVPDPAPLTAGGTFDRPSVADMIQVTVTSDAASREFTVRIENVAEDGVTLQTSDGGKPVRVSPGVWSVGDDDALIFDPGSADRGLGLEEIAEGGDVSVLSASLEPTAGVATPLSPGLIVIHDDGEPLFTEGSDDRGLGLELLAETGNPGDLADSFMDELPAGATSYTVFNTPDGATDPGPIHAGGAYDVDFEARPGQRLSFATMYGASNDWIFAFDADGVALFDTDGMPLQGDLTSAVSIWDVGTELNEEPGVGAHIGGPEGPIDTDSSVRIVNMSEYPVDADQHIEVTLTTR